MWGIHLQKSQPFGKRTKLGTFYPAESKHEWRDRWKEARQERDLKAEDKDVESMWSGHEKVHQLDSSCCPPVVHDVVDVGDEGEKHLINGEGNEGRVADDKDKDQPNQYVNHCSIPNQSIYQTSSCEVIEIPVRGIPFLQMCPGLK